MLIDKGNNSTLPPGTRTDPGPIPAPVKGHICVDKVNVGHTCYTGEVATCVHGCMEACAANFERKFYDEKFYSKFSHLFGKDLKKEEDCVETCSLSCRGCEKVVISGMKTINAPRKWSVYANITEAGGAALQIYQIDLSQNLVGIPNAFSTIYVNNKLMQRAGFPNCIPNVSAHSNSKRTPLLFLIFSRLAVDLIATIFQQPQAQLQRIRLNMVQSYLSRK
jgi:hypothetical protein